MFLLQFCETPYIIAVVEGGMAMTIGERIKQRRQELGLSADDLARKLGKDRATIYRYESDEIRNLPLNILEPLARALRVSPAYIMGWDAEMPHYRKQSVPVLVGLSGGQPLFAENHIHYYVEGDGAVDVDFCLRVRGGDMNDARIHDGDLVFIKQQSSVSDGETAAVVIGDDVVLGRIYAAGDGVIVEPLGRDGKPRLCNNDIQVLGKAVLVQSKL